LLVFWREEVISWGKVRVRYLTTIEESSLGLFEALLFAFRRGRSCALSEKARKRGTQRKTNPSPSLLLQLHKKGLFEDNGFLRRVYPTLISKPTSSYRFQTSTKKTAKEVEPAYAKQRAERCFVPHFAKQQ